MAYDQHIQSADQITANCAVVTLSDTRTEQTDTSGRRIRELLEQDGHRVVFYQVIKDDPDPLGALLDGLFARDDIDAILTTGGTGVSPRDLAIPVIERRLDSRLPGFGELFRLLSWQQIGSGAMLSRALAGVIRNKVIFAMPGSTKAVELAMTKLVLPELGHVLYDLRRGERRLRPPVP